jgi:hypothetical protein
MPSALANIDPTTPAMQIVSFLMGNAEMAGVQMSFSKAQRIARKVQRGVFDPELARVIQYSDPTGEAAVREVMRAA